MTSTNPGRRVLIVDDERVVADTLTHVFQKHGYEARSALSAELALELVSSWAPEAAILDVSLLVMNGIELAILLTDRCPHCHLLLFSGRPDSGDLVDEAAAHGNVFEIMAKPVHPSYLLDWTARKFATA
jgi:CheY-like chemotaxis protein